jgi:hypothetical protein
MTSRASQASRAKRQRTGVRSFILSMAMAVGVAISLLAPPLARADEVPPGPSGPIIAGPYTPKVGRFEFNFKLGPSIALQALSGAFGTAEFNLGIAVDRDRRFLITVSPTVNFIAAPLVLFTFPVGVQYDFQISRVSPNFYIYPALSAGYALLVVGGGSTGGGSFSGTGNLGVIQPTFGVKYVYRGRINIGFEPVSIPIIFSTNGAGALWRLTGYVGLVF